MRLGRHIVRGLGSLLALALVGALLTGCGGSGSLSKFGGDGSTPVVTVTPTPTATTTPGDDPPYFYTLDGSGNQVVLGAGDTITVTEGTPITAQRIFAVDPEGAVTFAPLAMDVPSVVMTVPAAGQSYLLTSDWVWNPDTNTFSYTPNYDTVQPGETSRTYTFNWRVSDGTNPDVTYVLTVTVLNQIYIDTLAGGGNGAGLPAIQAGFNNPTGVAYDPYGNLYVCIHGTTDYPNPRVVRILPNGVLENVAGNGRPGYNGDSNSNGVLAADASFQNPFGIDVDIEQNVYIADSDNHRIRKVTSDGRIFTVAGTGVAGFAGDGSSAELAQLNQPTSVSLDVPGNLYVADTKNQRIRRVSLADGSDIIETIAGNGTTPPRALGTATGLRAIQSPIGGPRGVAVDSSNQLHFCEAEAHSYLRVNLLSGILNRVTYQQEYTPDGLIDILPSGAYAMGDPRYVVDTGGLTTYDEDRGASLPRFTNFFFPRGIAAADQGQIFVADTFNHCIRMIDGTRVYNIVNRPYNDLTPVESFLADGQTFAGNPVIDGGAYPAFAVNSDPPIASGVPTIDLSIPSDVDYFTNVTTRKLAIADTGNNRVLVMKDLELVAGFPNVESVRWVGGNPAFPTYSGDYIDDLGNDIGGTPLNASFNKPQGIGFRIDTAPTPNVIDVYVADTYHNCIRTFSFSGNPSSVSSSTIIRFAGSRAPADTAPFPAGYFTGADPGVARSAFDMTYPTDVDPAPGSTIVLVCEAGNEVQGRIVWADEGVTSTTTPGGCGRVAYPAVAQLPGRPWSMVFSENPATPRRAWVTDYQRHVIWEVDFAADFKSITSMSVFAGLFGGGGYAQTTDDLNQALFLSPTAMAYWRDILSGREFILVCDTGNHRVAQVQVSGAAVAGSFALETVIGTGVRGWSPRSANATGTALDAPNGVWAHPSSGAVWVSDRNNNWIRKITGWDPLDSAAVPTQTVVAGSSDRSAGFGGDSGIPTDVALNQPTGLIGIPDPSDATDPTAVKWVYFVDSGNHRVRVLESDG